MMNFLVQAARNQRSQRSQGPQRSQRSQRPQCGGFTLRCCKSAAVCQIVEHACAVACRLVIAQANHQSAASSKRTHSENLAVCCWVTIRHALVLALHSRCCAQLHITLRASCAMLLWTCRRLHAGEELQLAHCELSRRRCAASWSACRPAGAALGQRVCALSDAPSLPSHTAHSREHEASTPTTLQSHTFGAQARLHSLQQHDAFLGFGRLAHEQVTVNVDHERSIVSDVSFSIKHASS